MLPVQVVPFDTDMLAPAAELLAARHRRDRAAMPLLPPTFATLAWAEKAIRATLDRPRAAGVVALRGDRLVAYLMGDWQISELWGRTGWVRAAGCAYDLEEGPEVVRDLYAALAESWVVAGIFSHFALIPAMDRALLDRWFSLSFGIELVHALLDLDTVGDPPDELPAGVIIRRARRADREGLMAMSDVIWRTQVRAPVWGAMLPEQVEEMAAGWGELVEDESVMLWVAEVRGEIVGSQGYWPAAPNLDELWLPEDAVRLSVASTRPAMRGRGIGRAMTRVGLVAARDAGHTICESDWRSTNLLASRFWPRRGFRPVTYRLVRRLDSRILWAKGKA